LELLLAEGLSLEQIGKRFARHPSTVSYWMEKYGLEAVNREKHLAKGGIDRALLTEIVEAAMSIAQIATDLGVGKATVRHWMRRYELRSLNVPDPLRAAAASAARADGRQAVLMSCPDTAKPSLSSRAVATTDASSAGPTRSPVTAGA
jgi:transposase